jgi:uncharacterized protein (TIGR03437 family)
VCHKGTIAGRALALAVGLLAAAAVRAQVPGPDWRRIGNSAVELLLAAPATGPVDTVWFSADGSRLYARVRSGRIFETLDYENWRLAANAPPPPAPEAGSAARLPEGVARTVAAPRAEVYALGQNLYRSSDGGRSWTNLTAFRGESVIGPGERGLAISPSDPEHLVVANDFGVWRSLDGGMSWNGLNQFLPNLPVRRILAAPEGAGRARIAVDGLGALELPAGRGAVWLPTPDPAVEREAQLKRDYSVALGAQITAVAAAGETVYAGAADSRIWVSFDSGRTWRPSPHPGTGPVEALVTDASQPRVALAALGAGSPVHVLRTTNSGTFWDDITANLPDAPARGLVADRAAGAVYVATDKGLFHSQTDLDNAGPAGAWRLLSANLPPVPVMDVKLAAQGHQLYVALEGYGVYAAAAPHRARTLRLVNAADLSGRAAAPGSLVSVLGGNVSAAQAGALHFPVLAASDTESQIQVPFEATGPNVSLALETQSGPYTLGLPVRPVSPAIFVSRDGAPMLLDGDTGLMLDAGNAARSGARVQILATGLGKVRPEWPNGLAAPLENPPEVIAPVRAFLDRVPVEVTRATLAPGYVGFYLIELQLPPIVNAGPAELYLSADGQESNRVQILLEP